MPTTSPLWTTQDQSLSGMKAAEQFAATFDPPRQIASIKGEWTNRDWSGWFTLVRGRRIYSLAYDSRLQTWAVGVQSES